MNNIPVGYKQTEVGVIPEDWEVKHLKKISPKQSVGLVINPSSYFDDNGTVPMLVGSNIKENGINWEFAKRITDASNKLIPASLLTTGDLVTVRVGEPGITAVIPPELDGCNCASVMIVRQHHTFDSNWLCYVMNSRDGRMQVENVQYGTAQKQFNISDAINFSYPVPPFAEQAAIATALSDVDALISTLDNLITKKRLIKQGAMQELLNGKKRLAGFSGDWKVKNLGDILKVIGGGAFKSNDSKDIGVKWLKIANVGINKTVWNEESYLPNELIKNNENFLLKNSDYVMALTRPILDGKLKIARLTNEDVPALLNQRVGKIEAENGNDVNFIYFLLQKYEVISAFLQSMAGTDPPNLSNKGIYNVDSLIPPTKAEQTAIAQILSDMDTDILALETQRNKTLAIKQGMMQELLTGKTRLI